MADETGDTVITQMGDKNWKFKIVIKNPLLEGMMTSTGLKDPQLTMRLKFDSPYETYIKIAVSFATKPDSPYSRRNLHQKAMCFYWHAFESAKADITLSKVIGLDDSMEEDSFLANTSWKDQLWRLTLTYSPENLVDFHLNEKAEYLREDMARRFTDDLRSLKRPAHPGDNRKTIHVYLSDCGNAPMTQARFDQLVTRLEQDRAAPCLSEYRRPDGSPLLNWGDTACGYNIDRKRLPRKTRFRTHEDNILTHGIGELREAGATWDLLPFARVTKLSLHFIAVGQVDENQQSRRYLAVGQGYHDSRLRRLLEIGDIGTLSFAKEKPPNFRFPTLYGWKYTVRSPMATFGVSNDLVLDVSRNIDDDHQVPLNTIEDDIKPDQDVYLSPDPSDITGKLLVRATKRMIQGTGPDFDKLRGYLSGQDFSPSDTVRFLSAAGAPSTDEERGVLSGIMSSFNSKQMEAAKVFVSGQHMLQLVQGSPGTGKTWWTAQMVKICAIAKIPVLATAPSNAATNALFEHLVRNDQNEGYGVKTLRYAGDFEEVKAMITLYRAYHSTAVPGVALAGIADDHDVFDDEETDEGVDILRNLATADRQHRSKRFAGLLDRSSLHCRVLEDAGLLKDGIFQRGTDIAFPEEGPYEEFRRLFLDPDSPIYERDSPEQEEVDDPTWYDGETSSEGTETTERAERPERPPPPPSISSVTRKALAIVASKASCIVATCVLSGADFIAKDFHPRVVFVDDAGTARVAEFCNAVIAALERHELALACLVADTERSRPIFGHKLGEVGVSGYINPMADQLKTGIVAQLVAENYPHICLREKL